MSTEVTWNDATPPESGTDRMDATCLVLVARNVGLDSVTEANREEWLWRYAFTQEFSGRPAGGDRGYGNEMPKFDAVLRRFMTATLVGRVASVSRERFIEEFVDRRIDAAREQADGALAELCSEQAA